MKVLEYAPSLLAQLTATYNAAVLGMPHCYPTNEEEMAAELSAVAHGPRHSDQVFVAMNGERMVGFVHAAVARMKPTGSPDIGMIRFLCYAPGQRRAGEALLTAAEDYLRERGMTRIGAFHQDHVYAFHHLPHAYLSDRLGHVHGLLAMRGYRRAWGEVFMDWPEYTPVEPALPDLGVDVSVALKWEPGNGKRSDLAVAATGGQGEEIGVCVNYSAGRPGRPPEAEDWFLTHWLSVSEPFRKKGLGLYLLMRALRELRGAGYRHAAISTSWDNHRAMLFYTNCGYHVADWTYGLARDLDRAPEKSIVI